jgi:hypothetical protein
MLRTRNTDDYDHHSKNKQTYRKAILAEKMQKKYEKRTQRKQKQKS